LPLFQRSRKPEIYCVVDALGWVQEKRVEYLSRYLGEFKLGVFHFGWTSGFSRKIPAEAGRPLLSSNSFETHPFKFSVLTPDRFVALWNRGRLRGKPIYFASWRIPYSLVRSERCSFDPLDFEHFMTSVTSHYNIGGGLNPSQALAAGRDPQEAFDSAITLLRQFNVVTANSRILCDLLSTHLDRLTYAPNGVDAAFFHPPVGKKYDPSHIKIGWVGKVKAAKNYEVVESALNRLRENGFTVRTLAFAKNVSKRRLLSQNEMKEFYHGIDYYLCASWHEGTPNPALEAAACGIPVVTTRVGNMPELVEHGENGFFIEPRADSIVEQFEEIRGLSVSDYLRLSTNVRSSILANWTWEKNVANYQMAFERLLSGGK